MPNPSEWNSSFQMQNYSKQIVGPNHQIPETAIFYRKKLSYLDDGRYCRKIRVDLKHNIFEDYLNREMKK